MIKSPIKLINEINGVYIVIGCKNDKNTMNSLFDFQLNSLPIYSKCRVFLKQLAFNLHWRIQHTMMSHKANTDASHVLLGKQNVQKIKMQSAKSFSLTIEE